MSRSSLLLLSAGVLFSAPSNAGDAPEVAVSVSTLEVPRVGTCEEFDHLIREYESVDGRVHANLKQASWVSVTVQFRPNGEEPVSEVWAAEPQLHRVQQAALVPATDTFITPGEIRRFREAAEQAIRRSVFVAREELDEQDDAARARLTLFWRVGSRGTVDLYGISRQFRRDEAILVDETTGAPVVVLLSGPMQEYEAHFSLQPGAEELLATRGIPADLIVANDSTRCGILGELPDGVIRGTTADVKPAIVEETRVRPSYPEQARIFRTGGTVVLDVLLDEEGAVEGAVVKRAAPGFPSLARSVVEAVCDLRYLPATQAGMPVQSVVEYKTTFELR